MNNNAEQLLQKVQEEYNTYISELEKKSASESVILPKQ